MQFTELIKEIKNTAFEELRKDSDNFFEAVVVKQDLTNLTKSLDKFFGTPAWPSKNKISTEVQDTIKDFGGIMPNQTLYFSGGNEGVVFAMLWPWSDGVHTTVKIGHK